MKLASFVHDGRETVGFAIDNETRVVPLSDAYTAAGLGEAPGSMLELIKSSPSAELAKAYEFVAANPSAVSAIDVNTVSWKAPVPNPSKILCVGFNNSKLTEAAHFPPTGPIFFLKPPSCLIGHKEAIEIDDDYGFTFPELELGVIIGKRARRISEAEALDHVFGYTIVDDVTSQGLKRGDSIAVDLTPAQAADPSYQEYINWHREGVAGHPTAYFTYHSRSKGADTFGAMGPWLTTRDEVADPNKLNVVGYADGDPFAEDTTASYTHNIARIISFASRYFTLEPGDVISCGTAARGVGKHTRAHQSIDMSKMDPEVAIEITGLGRLANPIRHVWKA